MACYNITKADEHNESVKLSIITLHFLCIINKFPVKDLYLNFDTLAIPELHTRQLLILVHKFLHHHIYCLLLLKIILLQTVQLLSIILEKKKICISLL